MAKIEITGVGFETLLILEQYMKEYISNPDELTDQLIDLVEERLSTYPKSCPVCPELESIGVTDYQQLTVSKDYKVIYRYDETSDCAYVMAFMRSKQSVEKLLVRYALIL